MARKKSTAATTTTLEVYTKPKRSSTRKASTRRYGAPMQSAVSGIKRGAGPQVDKRKMSAKWGSATARVNSSGNRLKRVLVKKKAATNDQHYWVRMDRD